MKNMEQPGLPQSKSYSVTAPNLLGNKIGRLIVSKKKGILRYAVKLALFAVYLIALCYGLFFAELAGRGGYEEFRYNFTPFQEIMRYIVYADRIGFRGVFLNLYGNILAFVPFGFFLPALFLGENHHPWLAVFLCFAFSAFVEATQLWTQVGCCDVDDVILNTAGGAIGYIIYRVYKWYQRKLRQRGEEL